MSNFVPVAITTSDTNHHEQFGDLLEFVEAPKNGTSILAVLPAICFELLGGTKPHIDKLVALTNILGTAIVLFDEILDDEIDLPKWQTRFAKINSIERGRGTLANVGPALLARLGLALASLEAELGLAQSHADALRVAFYEALHNTCGGQQADLLAEYESLDATWEIVRIKSGSFYSLLCFGGALLATEDIGLAEQYAQIGREIGVLVQISDDVADLWPQTNAISDVAHNRFTLPISYTCSVLSGREYDTFRQQLQAAASSPAAEEAARTTIINSGALLYLQMMMNKSLGTIEQDVVRTSSASEARTKLFTALRQIANLTTNSSQ